MLLRPTGLATLLIEALEVHTNLTSFLSFAVRPCSPASLRTPRTCASWTTRSDFFLNLTLRERTDPVQFLRRLQGESRDINRTNVVIVRIRRVSNWIQEERRRSRLKVVWNMVCFLSLGLCRAACRRSCLLSESCLFKCCADRHDATKVTLLRCSGVRFRGRGLLVVTECFTSKCLFFVKEIARTQKRSAATGIIHASAWRTFSGIFVVLFRQVSSFALS